MNETKFGIWPAWLFACYPLEYVCYQSIDQCFPAVDLINFIASSIPHPSSQPFAPSPCHLYFSAQVVNNREFNGSTIREALQNDCTLVLACFLVALSIQQNTNRITIYRSKPVNGDFRKDPQRERSRSPIERAAMSTMSHLSNHAYAGIGLASMSMEQPLALTKNSMDATRTVSIGVERQQVWTDLFAFVLNKIYLNKICLLGISFALVSIDISSENQKAELFIYSFIFMGIWSFKLSSINNIHLASNFVSVPSTFVNKSVDNIHIVIWPLLSVVALPLK